MRILHLSTSDTRGGASRAARRLHDALVSLGVNSRMQVGHKGSDDWRVSGPASRTDRIRHWAAARLDKVPARMQRTQTTTRHSPAWVGSISAATINDCETDLVNLHWICGGLLSIEAIGRIRKPLVWRLPDMWAFCGAEHYAPDGQYTRWRTGYTSSTRAATNWFLDIDKWAWRRKKNSWLDSIQIVAPSHWLAECAANSALMHDWPISVIPNALPTETYRPISKREARKIYSLPQDVPLVLFGALGGARDPRKGWDLLEGALNIISSENPNIEAAIFGQRKPRNPPRLPLRLHWLGQLHDDSALSLLYNAADVFVAPSRQEGFGQTASEAQACGCPVVAFDTTGLRDLVEHQRSGYLASPFDIRDLAAGITWSLLDGQNAHLAVNARQRALRLWSYEAVAQQYLAVYRDVLARTSRS